MGAEHPETGSNGPWATWTEQEKAEEKYKWAQDDQNGNDTEDASVWGLERRGKRKHLANLFI